MTTYPSTGMTMTLFNPSEAPKLHIELLPSNTIAVNVEVGPYSINPYSEIKPAFYINVWAPRSTPLDCRDSFDDETFTEHVCYDCPWHCESLEVDVDDVYASYEGEEVTLHGYANAYSPCSAYSDGLGEVNWPCVAGHDGPNDPDFQTDSDETLCADFLSYGIVVWTETRKNIADWADQQVCLIQDDLVYVSDAERAANTFDSTPHKICWGESLVPNNLQSIEQTFTTTYANEDLLTFQSHNEFAEMLQEQLDDFNAEDTLIISEQFTHKPNALPFSYEGRPMAIAVASVSSNIEAFMLMAASGSHIRDGLAMTRVNQFTNVAVTDDFIATVWISEELKAGIRLMFLDHPQDGHILLGQIPLTFDLTCKSIKPQSSDAEELVKSS